MGLSCPAPSRWRSTPSRSTSSGSGSQHLESVGKRDSFFLFAVRLTNARLSSLTRLGVHVVMGREAVLPRCLAADSSVGLIGGILLVLDIFDGEGVVVIVEDITATHKPAHRLGAKAKPDILDDDILAGNVVWPPGWDGGPHVDDVERQLTERARDCPRLRLTVHHDAGGVWSARTLHPSSRGNGGVSEALTLTVTEVGLGRGGSRVRGSGCSICSSGGRRGLRSSSCLVAGHILLTRSHGGWVESGGG